MAQSSPPGEAIELEPLSPEGSDSRLNQTMPLSVALDDELPTIFRRSEAALREADRRTEAARQARWRVRELKAQEKRSRRTMQVATLKHREQQALRLQREGDRLFLSNSARLRLSPCLDPRVSEARTTKEDWTTWRKQSLNWDRRPT